MRARRRPSSTSRLCAFMRKRTATRPLPRRRAVRSTTHARLLELVDRLVEAHRLAAGPDGAQRLALAPHVAGDEGGGHVEDRLARAVVLLEAEDARPREVALEVEDVARCRRRARSRSTGPRRRRRVRFPPGPARRRTSSYCARFVSWYSSTSTYAVAPLRTRRAPPRPRRGALSAQQQVVEVEGARGGEDRVVALLDALGQRRPDPARRPPRAAGRRSCIAEMRERSRRGGWSFSERSSARIASFTEASWSSSS